MKRLILISAVFVVLLLSQFGSIGWASPCCDGDYNCDSKVNFQDYVAFVGDFVKGLLKIDPLEICVNASIPKTGQTTPYFTGDDGYLQKGVAWPNPRFTDNGDGTVTDNLTALIWLKNANCFGVRLWDSAVLDCNKLHGGECGLTDNSYDWDWRLPNYKELFSLIDAENDSPALPTGHPFINVQSDYYWSSTTYAHNNVGAWYVSISNGNVNSGNRLNSRSYVWPVRGGQ
jgi:hypothetical protein